MHDPNQFHQTQWHASLPGRGGNGLVIALVVAIVLAVGGFGAWWFFFRDSGSTQPASQASVQEQQPSSQGQQQPSAQEQPQGQPGQQPSQAPSGDASAGADQTAPTQAGEEAGGRQQERQQEQSSAPGGKQEKQPKEQPSGRDDGASPPPLPERFGGFQAGWEPSETTAYYERADLASIVVMLFQAMSGEDLLPRGEQTIQSGPWTCAVSEGVTSGRVKCVAEAHGHTVSLSAYADRFSLEELAAAGDDFLAAWN